MKKFREEFQKSLPEGIDIEFDGEYVSMYSYKMKNYALLDADGEMVILTAHRLSNLIGQGVQHTALQR